MFDLTNRIALVTGASRGIGAVAARGLDRAGARVVLCSRDATGLRAVAGDLNNEPVVAAADLSSPTGISTLVGHLRERRVAIDVLVNNAGVHEPSPAAELTMAAWDRVLNLNLRCAFELSKELAPAMAARGWGRIINVASVLALVADSNSAAYVASKSGLVGLTRALSAEWASAGIGVNALCPGWVQTDMVKDLADNPAFDRRVHRRTPIHRWLTPDDLVGPLVFLASRASHAMTGQTLVVDGGLTATW